MKEALLIVLDSVGIGHAPDAVDFGDAGANTLGHLRETIPGFALPNLDAAGLAAAEAIAAGSPSSQPEGGFVAGCLTERSAGKDTVTGHWEMAGVPVLFDWGYFPQTVPCFDDEFINELSEWCQ